MRAYENDYAGWAEDTARAICEGRWSEIDRSSLADEVADLGKKVQWQMLSRLEVLLAHLLKQRYQPAKATRSWDLTVQEQRFKLERLLGENPSLRAKTDVLVSDAYQSARYAAQRETDLELAIFPESLPFTDIEIWGERRPDAPQ